MADKAESDVLWVRYETTPVDVVTSTGHEHRLEIDLCDGIQAIESFPATSNTGKYTLELSKEVGEVANVRSTCDELVATLMELSLVWSFVGGTRMDLRSVSEQSTPQFTTNVNELQKKMLARKGQSRVAHSLKLQYSTVGTYSDFPLQSASVMLQSLRSDFHLRMMLEYLNMAYQDKSTWFVHLYKIRDALRYAAEKQTPKLGRFGVEEKSWKRFGRILNEEYDLRHALKNPGPAPSISDKEKCFVFKLATGMIEKYLNFHELIHS